MKKYVLFATAAVLLLTFASPAIEASQDVIVGDAAITKTCSDRHGFNFVGRWSCRSGLRGIGLMGLAFSCAFNKEDKSDICVNFDLVKKDNDEQRLANKQGQAK